jgi:hypothetical protein
MKITKTTTTTTNNTVCIKNNNSNGNKNSTDTTKIEIPKQILKYCAVFPMPNKNLFQTETHLENKVAAKNDTTTAGKLQSPSPLASKKKISSRPGGFPTLLCVMMSALLLLL